MHTFNDCLKTNEPLEKVVFILDNAGATGGVAREVMADYVGEIMEALREQLLDESVFESVLTQLQVEPQVLVALVADNSHDGKGNYMAHMLTLHAAVKKILG